MKKSFPLILILSISTSAWASGFSKPVQVGPKAVGMGGAFVGIADDPTAIYHNPAGMVGLTGYQIELGSDSLISDLDYTPDQTAAPGAPVEKADTQFIMVPQFAITTDAVKPVALGLGIFFPHGNGGKFSSPSVIPTNPDEGKIYSMEIDPAVAIELMKGLSIGGSIRAVWVSSMLKNQLFAIGPAVDMLSNLDVSGWGIGGAVGVLYKPCKFFSWGFNWRSKVQAGVSGNATFATLGTLGASYDQVLPTLITTGVGLKPIDGLTVGMSYDFENNSEINTLNVDLQSVGTVALPQNWKDSHTFHIGAEYWFFPSMAIRAGYAKDFQASIPDSGMNRIIGDIAASEVSAGLAYNWNRYLLAATWNGRFGERTIPLNGTTNVGPGNYSAFVNMISLGVTISL